ncbi:ribose-phosphate diphosphokinase [Pseudomaricurvus sp. HS19]|uniref:ribose-phosphate diphosphokinase n=1 Tax=Pseudomaricurvus sp. HS19 TaxID=2692626 RepID=UPI001369ECFD|nr:ribose-phosphate diphosphokinase [Pseudomaricurvus sp. HS19]MYM62291.1 ribose-phosphate diphosphokinase [Pseudomaricurvus sp. HS19]
MSALFLCSVEEKSAACPLAQALAVPCLSYECHRFPDQELRLTLPLQDSAALPATVVLYRSLDRPNDKLVELLLIARHLRRLGARQLILVAPYLAYMRQDIAFHSGEIVSQTIVGQFLAELFDGVITVDPHLHRIERLEQAIPLSAAVFVSGAPRLADLIRDNLQQPLLIGPDAESRQWVESAAVRIGADFGVCQKVRRGDRDVTVELPDLPVNGRQVVVLDDVASSGHTLAQATRALLNAGAATVDVAVTHALFAGDAVELLKQAGVGNIWSTDTIIHDSNAISMAPLLAEALTPLLNVPLD